MVDPVKSTPAEEPKTTPKKKEEKSWLGRTVVVVLAVAVTVAVAYCLYEFACYIKDVAADKFSKESDQALEERAKKRGLGDLVGKVKQISAINKRMVIKRLAICKEHEVQIFTHLQDRFTFTVDHLKEMLMGAHIRLNDQGTTYDGWAKFSEVNKRISSHPSDGQQYSVRGSVIKELLFSAISDKEKTFTWFQLENHPVSFGSMVRHMIDYVKYKLSSANQGPYGSSPVTDLAPLCIETKP